MLESDVQRACLEWLAAKRIFVWRQNQAAVPLEGGGFRRFAGLRGVSDILGILPQTFDVAGCDGPQTCGNLLAIEVKGPKGRLSPEQQEFLDNVNKRGGIGICVHSVDELEEAIEPYLEA